jgi:hypothetical protein
MSFKRAIFSCLVFAGVFTWSSATVCAEDAAKVPKTDNTNASSAHDEKEPAKNAEPSVEDRIEKLGKAIISFKSMGVGVTPFENLIAQAKKENSEGKQADSISSLNRLNSALEAQQTRYYSDKIRAWRAERKNLIAARVAALKTGGTASDWQRATPSQGLSKGTNEVLTKAKGEYKPMIYPIGR